MARLLQDLDVFDLIDALEQVERRGGVSDRALTAFRIRFVLGDDPDTARLRGICSIPTGQGGEAVLAQLIEEVESAWAALQGNGRVE